MDYAEQQLSDINDDIQNALVNMNLAENLDKQLEQARHKQTLVRKHLSDLKQLIVKKEKKYKRLSQVSFSNLYHTLHKDKVTKTNEIKQTLETLHKELSTSTEELTAITKHARQLTIVHRNSENAIQVYDDLINEKIEFLKVYFPERWITVSELHTLLETANNEVKQIEESIYTAKLVLQEYNKIKSAVMNSTSKQAYAFPSTKDISHFFSLVNSFATELRILNINNHVNFRLSAFLTSKLSLEENLLSNPTTKQSIRAIVEQLETFEKHSSHILIKLQAQLALSRNNQKATRKKYYKTIEKI